MEQQKEYYAFISYKREDEKWAKWLQHKLEHYKFPTNMNGRTDLPKNIRPTFRDVTDLKPGLLAEEINNALRNSEWLIVVCSPRSAKSPWVCKEAQAFIDLGCADHIIPFVIEGNPFSNDFATECYPQALLNLTGSKELLAANINEMGRDAAAIKVVARMFNLRFDTLWQRHEREQRRKRWFIIGGTLLFALASLGIGGYIAKQNHELELKNKEVEEERDRANTERDRANSERDKAEAANTSLLVANDSIQRQYKLIEQQKNEIVLERDNVKKANQQMMINKAHFISQEALQLIKEGDTYRAIALLLEVLPDSEHTEKPWVGDAEKILRIALDSLNRSGYVPIAHLDCLYDRAAYYEYIQDLFYDEKDHILWIQFHISDDSGNIINGYNIDNGGLLYSYIQYNSGEEYEEIQERCGFDDYLNGGTGISNEYFFECNKYKLKKLDKKFVLFKKHIATPTTIYYELPIGPENKFDKKSFCENNKYMIIQDSIYDVLTGKSVRSIGLPIFDIPLCDNKIGII